MNVIYFVLRLIKLFPYLIIKGNLNPLIRNLKASNEVCYILGNGPSLINQLDESKIFINQETLFVINNFALTDYYKKLKPKYYIFADPCYWDDKMYLNEYLKSQAILYKVAKETDWEINIIAPYLAKNRFKDVFSDNKNINLYFVNTFSLLPSIKKITYFLYSKYYSCPQYQNVLILASFVAINIGYREVNLFGCEHSWTENIRVNDNNQVCIEDKHFYELKPKLSPWIKVNGEVYNMSEILIDLSKMFQGYYYIKDYAKYKNTVIYNCTPNSYIDAFDRKKYE